MKFFTIKNKILPNLEGEENADFYQFLKQSQKTNLSEEVNKTVSEIITHVKNNGDEALIAYSNQFDKSSFSEGADLLVTQKDFSDAEKSLDKEVKEALKLAYRRIFSYHKKQLPSDFYFTDSFGVELGNSWRAIESVGIYVPGGTASYPSSVLMSAIPALVAGVNQISICAPSTAGKLNPAVLYAAKICEIEKIYKIGGAQAIAAMAYGTKTVAKVNKIVGPGNAYVACAKKHLFGEVGIDMIAGPTDITIIADESCKAPWVAADALSQLEHGPDSKAIIIVDNENFAQNIFKEINELAKSLPRFSIICESLKNSAILIIENLDDAVHLANFIAPEHLEIATQNSKKLVHKIKNAGAIFLGNHTPESIGDYVAGPSHTLPTEGTAKFSSGLSVFDFLKRISLISCNKKSFTTLAKSTATLAECENLHAHKLSIEIRKS